MNNRQNELINPNLLLNNFVYKLKCQEVKLCIDALSTYILKNYEKLEYYEFFIPRSTSFLSFEKRKENFTCTYQVDKFEYQNNLMDFLQIYINGNLTILNYNDVVTETCPGIVSVDMYLKNRIPFKILQDKFQEDLQKKPNILLKIFENLEVNDFETAKTDNNNYLHLSSIFKKILLSNDNFTISADTFMKLNVFLIDNENLFQMLNCNKNKYKLNKFENLFLSISHQEIKKDVFYLSNNTVKNMEIYIKNGSKSFALNNFSIFKLIEINDRQKQNFNQRLSMEKFNLSYNFLKNLHTVNKNIPKEKFYVIYAPNVDNTFSEKRQKQLPSSTNGSSYEKDEKLKIFVSNPLNGSELMKVLRDTRQNSYHFKNSGNLRGSILHKLDKKICRLLYLNLNIIDIQNMKKSKDYKSLAKKCTTFYLPNQNNSSFFYYNKPSLKISSEALISSKENVKIPSSFYISLIFIGLIISLIFVYGYNYMSKRFYKKKQERINDYIKSFRLINIK